jgi:hypothetical protein
MVDSLTVSSSDVLTLSGEEDSVIILSLVEGSISTLKVITFSVTPSVLVVPVTPVTPKTYSIFSSVKYPSG